MRYLRQTLFTAAAAVAALVVADPRACTADEGGPPIEISLDVGRPSGYADLRVGFFAIDGAIQDTGDAFGEYVTRPDGTRDLMLLLSGEYGDLLLEIDDVEAHLGYEWSVTYSSAGFSLVGDEAGGYAGLLAYGAAAGEFYYSDGLGGAGWGYPSEREDWLLQGTVIEPPPVPLATLSIGNAVIEEGDRSSRFATFEVTLSAASEHTVTVDYTTSDGTALVSDGDYCSASGTLTFAPGQTSQTIRVEVYGDRKVEADETFRVTLSNAVEAEIAQSEGTGTILNDDKRGR
jgi:Calx-beta domain